MEYKQDAENTFFIELTNTDIVVKYNHESAINGVPIFDGDDDSYTISPIKPVTEFELLLQLFTPFSISINDTFFSPPEMPFVGDNKYSKYINRLSDEFISEIEQNIQLRINTWMILNYLNKLKYRLNEIKSNYIKEDSYSKSFSVHNTVYENFNIKINDDYTNSGNISPHEKFWVNYALSYYWRIQLESIQKILDSVELGIDTIKSSDDYVNPQKIIDKPGNLIWNKSDTDLLELIVALLETQSLSSKDYSLTRKDLVFLFSQFFGREIKDFESKLTRATERKKDTSPYLTKLKLAFENYCQSKIDRQE